MVVVIVVSVCATRTGRVRDVRTNVSNHRMRVPVKMEWCVVARERVSATSVSARMDMSVNSAPNASKGEELELVPKFCFHLCQHFPWVGVVNEEEEEERFKGCSFLYFAL